MKYCTKKTCDFVGQLQDLNNFNKCSKYIDGLQKKCKSCQHKYYMQNRDKIIQKSLENQKNNPNRKIIVRKNDLKRKFGISLEEYDFLIKKQNNLCGICNKKTEGKNFSVDHNYMNGKIRGLLCNPCNLLLGNAKENIVTLLNAIKYLELYNGN